MQRKIAAFVAFNAYLFCILIAFYNALPELFHLNFRSSLSPLLPDPYFETPQWDFRRLPFLLLSLLATSIAAVLAGAIVKSRGGVVAAKSAIPITIVWIEIFSFLFLPGPSLPEPSPLRPSPHDLVLLLLRERRRTDTAGILFRYDDFRDLSLSFYLDGVSPFRLLDDDGRLASLSCRCSLSQWPGCEFFRNASPPALPDIHSPSFLGMSALLHVVYKILTGRIFKIQTEWGRALFTMGLLVVVPIVLYRVLWVIGRLMRLIPLEGFNGNRSP